MHNIKKYIHNTFITIIILSLLELIGVLLYALYIIIFYPVEANEPISDLVTAIIFTPLALSMVSIIGLAIVNCSDIIKDIYK